MLKGRSRNGAIGAVCISPVTDCIAMAVRPEDADH